MLTFFQYNLFKQQTPTGAGGRAPSFPKKIVISIELNIHFVQNPGALEQ
jgi:hypothetical protein